MIQLVEAFVSSWSGCVMELALVMVVHQEKDHGGRLWVRKETMGPDQSFEGCLIALVCSLQPPRQISRLTVLFPGVASGST